jgi:3-methyl-2-oxobutanoate hydroxymethyltransferase
MAKLEGVMTGDRKISSAKPVAARDLVRMKEQGHLISVLTAYDFYTARMLDQIGIEGVLIGDSANMVFYGEPSTLSITLDQMIYHARAVSRAVRRALVVGDMPFMSYQASMDDAVRNCGRMIKEGGAAAVKLEGGEHIAPLVHKLVEIGIPVMGHIGLVPQSIHQLGSFKVQGKDDPTVRYLKNSARVLQDAGCFAIVLEMIKADVAGEISRDLNIPTIGIGSGPDCDGQILVINDLVGLFEDFQPKFVRRYAHVAQTMREACTRWIEDVRGRNYPADDESYH